MVKKHTAILTIGRFSGTNIHDVRDFCEYHDVDIKAIKLNSGLFNTTYQVDLEGEEIDIAKVLMRFPSFHKGE